MYIFFLAGIPLTEINHRSATVRRGGDGVSTGVRGSPTWQRTSKRRNAARDSPLQAWRYAHVASLHTFPGHGCAPRAVSMTLSGRPGLFLTNSYGNPKKFRSRKNQINFRKSLAGRDLNIKSKIATGDTVSKWNNISFLYSYIFRLSLPLPQ